MQSAIGSRHKDRKRSTGKQGSTSGGYYQFTFEEEFSASDEDLDTNFDLSPKERVAKILQETELGPISIEGTEVPEPDFRLDFFDELNTSYTSGDRASPTTLSKTTGGDFNNRHSYSNDEGRPATPESLHSPLDHPDSGYIDFVQPRHNSSGPSERSPSEGFEDDFHISGSGHSIDNNESSDRSTSPPNSKQTLPTVRFTRFRSDKLEENSYIDDDILKSRTLEGSMEVEMEDLSGPGDLYRQGTNSSRLKTGDTYLPMSPDMTLEHDEEAMLDPGRGAPDEDDRNPIIFVDQTILAARYQKRRKRCIIAVGIIAVLFGVAGLTAITYFLVKFLKVAE